MYCQVCLVWMDGEVVPSGTWMHTVVALTSARNRSEFTRKNYPYFQRGTRPELYTHITYTVGTNSCMVHTSHTVQVLYHLYGVHVLYVPSKYLEEGAHSRTTRYPAIHRLRETARRLQLATLR
jgi:hypothetical protein